MNVYCSSDHIWMNYMLRFVDRFVVMKIQQIGYAKSYRKIMFLYLLQFFVRFKIILCFKNLNSGLGKDAEKI